MPRKDTHWLLLDCGHRLVCGCHHDTGAPAWCLVCGEDRTVTGIETADTEPAAAS